MPTWSAATSTPRLTDVSGPKLGVTEWTIAGNLTYTIVKGLTIGAEVSYTQAKEKNVLVSDGEDTAYGDIKHNVWAGGVRLKRSF